MTALALIVGVPSAALAAHGGRTLDVELEAASGTAGAANDVIVKLSSAATAAITINAEITGPNDTDAGLSPESPDKTCEVAAASDTCTITFTPTAPTAPNPSTVDTFRVWIAGTDTQLDSTEDVDETRFPGAVAEPDATDFVFRVTNPTVPPFRTIDCKNPSTGTAVAETDSSLKSNTGTGSKETFTCNVKIGGQNAFNQAVDAENMSGPNDTEEGTDPTQRDYSCTTDASGNCSITIPANDLNNGTVGTAYLCFWSDDNGGDTYDTTLTGDGGACPERWDADALAGDIAQADVLKITWEIPVASLVDITSEDLAKDPDTDNAVFPLSLKDQFGTVLGNGDLDFKVLTGPNKKVTATKDYECLTGAEGTCDITHTPNSFKFNGTDKVCAWWDSDGDDVYTAGGDIADGGGCATEPASAGEDNPNLTDRGVVVWSGGTPAPTRLEALPETQSATASTSKVVEFLVTDEQQVALPAAKVDVELNGVGDPRTGDPEGSDNLNAPDAFCTTGVDGKCSITIVGSAVGDTHVRAWVDIDNDDQGVDDGEVDTAEGPDAGSDQEPQGGTNVPGLVEESDTTDVVAIKWTASPTSVTMNYSAPTITWGTQITLAGFLKDGAGLPLSGRRVIVERRLGGQFAFGQLSSSLTDANGRWSWTGKPGSTADYRASFLAEPPGYQASKSSIIKVAVRVVFSELPALSRQVAPGTAVPFTGKVLPNHSGRRVYLQVLGPKNSWRNVATTLCDGNGAFRMTYRRNVAGTLNFRILFPAQDADHGGNLSPKFSVRWG